MRRHADTMVQRWRVAIWLVASTIWGTGAEGQTQAFREGPVLTEPSPSGEAAGGSMPAPLPPGAVTRYAWKSSSDEWSGIYQIEFSPDGQLAVLRDQQQQLHVCENPSGQVKHVLRGHEGIIKDIQFSPGGHYLASTSASSGEATRLWNVREGREVQQWSHAAHLLRFVDAQQLILVGAPEVMRGGVGGEQRNAELIGRVPNHTTPQAINHTGDEILLSQPNLARTQQYPLMAFDVATSRTALLTQLPFAPARVVYSPRDDTVAVCGNRSAEIVICQPGKMSTYRLLEGHDQTVYALAFSADQRHLASGSFDGTVRLWETLTWRTIKIIQGHRDHVNAVAFSPSGQWLATGAAGRHDQSAYLWSLRALLLGKPGALVDAAAADWDAQWQALGDDDPAVAYRAMARFLHGGDAATRALDQRLTPATRQVPAAQINLWIKQLDDPRYAVREEAHARLLRFRNGFHELLAEARADARSLEARVRLQRLLQEQGSPTAASDEQLRSHRLVYLLETRGDGWSKQQLRAFVDGHPDRAVVLAARQALRRLDFAY